MPSNPARSRYETQLAKAHQSLYWAYVAADDLGDEGAADDCMRMLNEISRLATASLAPRSRRRKPPPAQLSTST